MENRREYAFLRKRVLAVAACARHHDACATGNGGNSSIAWVRNCPWNARDVDDRESFATGPF
jgi:hypothetical protein